MRATSGGGYRAMLFHAGAIFRMNELGLLPKLDRVSSVSGGSMTAAALAVAYPRLAYDASGCVDEPTRGLPRSAHPAGRRLDRRRVRLRRPQPVLVGGRGGSTQLRAEHRARRGPDVAAAQAALRV